jgi:hypothetical protein
MSLSQVGRVSERKLQYGMIENTYNESVSSRKSASQYGIMANTVLTMSLSQLGRMRGSMA